MSDEIPARCQERRSISEGVKRANAEPTLGNRDIDRSRVAHGELLELSFLKRTVGAVLKSPSAVNEDRSGRADVELFLGDVACFGAS